MEIFRPVFVYALHLSHTNPNQNCWLSEEQAVKNDLASLLTTARSGHTERLDSHWETVWFAVYSWLDEVLGGIPHWDCIAKELLPETDQKGTEFYRRLGELLTPNDDGVISAGALEAVRVYSFCLEHEYRGYYRRPGYEHQRQAYRRRCRQALEAVLSPDDLAPAPEPGKKTRRQLTKVAVWVLPVVVTILLYGMYRTLLKDLYHSVVG